jgi:hypothetical protein
MNIVSTNINDASAGTGARTIEITGLDENYNVISEIVPLNGTTDVLTSNAYLRVTLMEQKTGDAGALNIGDITATASTAATVQAKINIGIGISKNSQLTVPAGKKFLILSAELNATKIAAGVAPNISIGALSRSFGVDSPWITVVSRKLDTSVIDQLMILQPISKVIDEKSDLRFTATTDQNNTEVRVRYYGVLVNK